MIEALYYDRLDDKKVRCRLCPQECLIYPGKVGICYVRQNQDGVLKALTHSRVSSVHLDPIEKKPLHFFHPGSKILSVGSVGCNLGCSFCQNWEIAHPKDRTSDEPARAIAIMTSYIGVEELVNLAREHQSNGNIGVAYTYNEPLIWAEYLLEAAPAIRVAGLKNVLVTNGYINEAPLSQVLPYIDAINIDVKGFSEEFYRSLGGRLSPVLNTAEMANRSCHIEITNLLISGLNTDAEQIEALVNWVADKLGNDTPLHFSRYFPSRRLRLPPTLLENLERAGSIAENRLKFVRLGNV